MGEAKPFNEKGFYKKPTLKSLKFNERGRKGYKGGKTCGKLQVPTEVADYRAQLLVNTFDAPQCRLFFLKCIYHLPEATIQAAVDLSMRPNVKSHIRYFTVAAKRELNRVGC